MQAKVAEMMLNNRPLEVEVADAHLFGVFDVNEGSKKGIG